MAQRRKGQRIELRSIQWYNPIIAADFEEHIARHGVAVEEVEDALMNPFRVLKRTTVSATGASGQQWPYVCYAETIDGRLLKIPLVFVKNRPRPLTAYSRFKQSEVQAYYIEKRRRGRR